MIDPELRPFLDIWEQKWSSLKPGANPRERDIHFEWVAQSMRLPTPGGVDPTREEWVDSPGGKCRVRIFRHLSEGPQACLVYMHGGAWMQGSPETHWDITARIASFARMTVISVDYAKAPYSPFPAAILQCASVVEWVVANAAGLGIDGKRVSIGGDSAGANLAAAIALKFKGTEIRLLSQLLIYPAVQFEQDKPAYAENANGPLLSVAAMPAVNAMYLPNSGDRDDPLAAPIKAKDHSGLPPAYVAVAEFDPLRDDGVDYAAVLNAAGSEAVLDFGHGLIHGYLRAYDFCQASRERLAAMCDWLSSQNKRM